MSTQDELLNRLKELQNPPPPQGLMTPDMVAQVVRDAIAPYAKKLEELTPVVNQHNEQARQQQQVQQKQSFSQMAAMFGKGLLIANEIFTPQQLEWIVSTFGPEIETEKSQTGSTWLQAAQTVIQKYALWFMQTKTGKEWAQLGIDSLVGEINIAKEKMNK